MFMDSFDHNNSSTNKWVVPPTDFVTGRDGTGQAVNVGTTGIKYSSASLTNNPYPFHFAFSYRNGLMGGSVGPKGVIWELTQYSNTGGIYALRVVIENTYHINMQIFNSAGNIVPTTNVQKTNFYLKHGVWYNFELILNTVGGTVTNVTLYINEQVVLPATWTHNDISGSNGIITSTEVMLYRGYFDDVLITRSSTPVGDVHIQYLKPIADTHSDFTPSTGTDNYAMVDDAVPDNYTTYNESTTVGAYDLFQMEEVPEGYDIIGAQVIAYAEKHDWGPGIMDFLVETPIEGINLVGELMYLTVGDFVYHTRGFHINPDTGDEYTVEEFNAARFGYKKRA